MPPPSSSSSGGGVSTALQLRLDELERVGRRRCVRAWLAAAAATALVVVVVVVSSSSASIAVVLVCACVLSVAACALAALYAPTTSGRADLPALAPSEAQRRVRAAFAAAAVADDTTDVVARRRTAIFSPHGRHVRLTHGQTHYVHVTPTTTTTTTPLVVLLHGFSSSSRVWLPYQDALARDGVASLAIDFFGHGFSAAPRNVLYDERLFAAQVFELLSLLRLLPHRRHDDNDADGSCDRSGGGGGGGGGGGAPPELHLVGYSMGGGVAAAFCALYPRLASSTALFCPVGFPVAKPLLARFVSLPVLADYLFSRIGGAQLSSLVARAFVDDAARARNAALVVEMTLDKRHQASASSSFLPALLNVLRNFDMGNLAHYYEALALARTPVLLVMATRDTTVPIANEARLLRALSALDSQRLRAVRIDEGHYLPLVYFDRCFDELRAHLGRHSTLIGGR